MSGPGRNETQRRLIDVASRMFADGSVDGVSIRSITREADVGPAAVHYHFRSKDGLLDAVLERHGRRVTEEIVERGRALDRSPDRPTARAVVESVALPYFELLAREPISGAEWLQIVAQRAGTDDLRTSRVTGVVIADLHSRVRACFPGQPEERSLQATIVAVRSLLSLVSRVPADPAEREASREIIIDFIAGGLTAAITGRRPTTAAYAAVESTG